MRLLSLLLAMAISVCASAQAPDFGGKAQREGMKKLSFMLGEWSGSGWAVVQGHKGEFKGTEVISERALGVIFSLEGNHTTSIGGRDVPIHNAFGTLRFDEKKGAYFMRSHLANGLEMEYEFTALPNGYKWSQFNPTWGGNVTYTAEFNGDDWLEYGEAEKDGAKTRVYEMRMKRKAK